MTPTASVGDPVESTIAETLHALHAAGVDVVGGHGEELVTALLELGGVSSLTSTAKSTSSLAPAASAGSVKVQTLRAPQRRIADPVWMALFFDERLCWPARSR